ncbi:MAG: ATP-dependent zinc metalloprotease FtsH [Clostridia bacterium]|nr:ATP-dependent zinc metalloprotease FtsH [Clostridia bacterium]
MKNNFKILLFYGALIAVILVVSALVLNEQSEEPATFSDIVQAFSNEQVESFLITNKNEIQILTKDNRNITFALRDYTQFMDMYGEMIDNQLEAGIISSYDIEQPVTMPWWFMFIPYAIVALLMVFFWIFMMNQANGGRGGKINSFGKSRARIITDDKNKVTFENVAGADEEKEELREIVEFLRDPAKFTKLGAKIPHGVLLVGPPGTGKTLLAKAVAGEAGVPFFSISGSDFVEMYVGVGASRVRDLFDTARKHPASIIFIDEIDAVGRHRGAGLGGGHDEREQTLNQLLVEMDGFGSHSGIIVIAATNRPDILDPALLRPGRFDRQVTVDYPDTKGRLAILNVHAKGKPFEDDVDLETVAKSTTGFTGADLSNLLNEAALLAARRGKQLIGMNDIEDATTKVIVGPQKTSKVINEKDKRITAFHEAGHAIVGKIIQPDEAIHQISIIPSGRAAGYTLSLPIEERSHMSKNDMQNQIVMLLGGRVAEAIVIGDICTGASNDIQRATNIARSMVTKYGMSDLLGPVVYGSAHGNDEVFLGRDFNNEKNYSERTASTIDDEIKKIISAAYDKAKEILESNREKLDFIAEFLLRYEVMDEGQFKAAMEGNPSFEELDAMKSEKRKKSELENKRAKEAAEAAAKSKAAAEGADIPAEPESDNSESSTDNSSENKSDNKKK